MTKQEKTEEIEFLKKIIELTYKDGKNTKAQIRNMAKKRIVDICCNSSNDTK